MSDTIAANDGPVSEWGRFISEVQHDELRFMSRVLTCSADLLTGEGAPPQRGDVEALIRVFAERLEDIMVDDLPAIRMEADVG